VRPFESDLRFHSGFSSEELKEVLGDHREYFFIDAIKLIEAAEGASGSETLEIALYKEMVHTIGAVEDNTVLGQGFGKILGGLCLSSSCRTSGSTTEVKLQSSHKSHIAFISERGDHKTAGVAEVLVTVREACDYALNPSLHGVILIKLPVVPELHDPFEGVYFRNLVFD